MVLLGVARLLLLCCYGVAMVLQGFVRWLLWFC